MGRTVLVVGGGGREHALTIGLLDSPSVSAVHVAPGNAGTAGIAINHDVSASDIDAQVALAKSIGADLVVVGPEAPLVEGLSDSLRAVGIPSFGPAGMRTSTLTILIELVSLLGDFLSGRLDEYIVISIVKVVIDVNDGTALHLGHLPHIVGGPATDFPFMSVRIGSPSP